MNMETHNETFEEIQDFISALERVEKTNSRDGSETPCVIDPNNVRAWVSADGRAFIGASIAGTHIQLDSCLPDGIASTNYKFSCRECLQDRSFEIGSVLVSY